MPKTATVVSLLAILPALMFGQQTALQISSPAQNSVINPGQVITITVSITPGANFSNVGILGTDPLGDLGPITAPPYQFILDVPSKVPYGPYQLTALGIDGSGNLSLSAPLAISIEPTIGVTALSTQPSKLQFQYVGQQLPLNVVATLADGTIANLTQSSTTAYTSTNTQIVTVNGNGIATAAASGSGASITIRRGSLSVTVPVVVPAAVKGDLNADGVIDQNDLNIITLALNTPATKPFDARDLNGDGVINALDARILVTLCSRAGCATH